MHPIKRYFRISIFLSVVPFCIYAFLYWYPSFSFFTYIDNGIFTWLWEMKWIKFIAFVSAPASLILLLLMGLAMRKNDLGMKEKIMFYVQLVIAITYSVYWFVLLRIILMI